MLHLARKYATSQSYTKRVRQGVQQLGFYDLLLDLPESSRVQLQQPSAVEDAIQETDDEDKRRKARAVFGERTAVRVNEAAARRTAQTHTYAGVQVAPRPQEPQFCCGSGCVNCVWLLYKDDMESWKASHHKAIRALLAAGEPVPPELGGLDEESTQDLDPGLRAFIQVEDDLRRRRQARQEQQQAQKKGAAAYV